jgi:hypothetical protein
VVESVPEAAKTIGGSASAPKATDGVSLARNVRNAIVMVLVK